MSIASFLQTSRYMQYVCVITVTLLQACVAMIATWISPVLPRLRSNESPLGVSLTEDEESWLVGAEKIGSVIGSLLAAWLPDKIGRKLVLLLAAVPLFVSWIIAAFTKVPLVLIVSQVIAGIGSGITYTALPIYIGEIAEKDIRGTLAIIQSILSTFGSVFVLVVGPFVSYTVLTLSCAIFPVIFVFSFFFMPETPYFLVKNGNMQKATKSIYHLSMRNVNGITVEDKLEEIKKTVANDISNTVSAWDLVTKKNNRRAFLICFALKTIAVLSGKFVMNSYLQTIIKLSGSSITPEISSIIFGFVQIPSTLLAATLVDRVGRRPLLIVSSIGCAIAMISEGAYFYLHDETQMDLSMISWLPTTSLTLYLLFITFGIMILPGVIMGEMFSIGIKSIAVSCISLYGSLFGFLVSKFFQPLANEWGVYTMFWIFAAACIFGSLFGFIGLPETKGKSFLEIQQMLSENNKVSGAKPKTFSTTV